MAYTRGTNTNILVGAAALFVTTDSNSLTATTIPGFVAGESYRETLSLRYNPAITPTGSPAFRNVGYTNNGLELTFAPDFGEVMVDQLLDTAKIFKQGMKVTLKTTLAEATLENLLLAIAGKTSDFGTVNLNETQLETQGLASLTAGLYGSSVTAATLVATVVDSGRFLNLTSGDLGDYPIERGIIAVGPGVGNKSGVTGTPSLSDQAERVYIAYRAVSIDSVTVSAKRDSATAFEVSFRLLPDDNGTYGKIVDRNY
jgi:hypothetical protein